MVNDKAWKKASPKVIPLGDYSQLRKFKFVGFEIHGGQTIQTSSSLHTTTNTKFKVVELKGYGWPEDPKLSNLRAKWTGPKL